MDNITERLSGIISIPDDTYVFGKKKKKKKKTGTKWKSSTTNESSPEKWPCIQRQQMSYQPAINILQSNFFSQRMKPDQKEVQALQDLPTPQTQKELQSFLGLINYLQPFLPDIAHMTNFLREQVSN